MPDGRRPSISRPRTDAIPRRTPRRTATVALIAVLATAAAACSSGGTSAGGAVTRGLDRAACRTAGRAPFPKRDDETAGPGIEQLQVDFVDHDRSTPATDTRRERPCRVLPTQVHLPAVPTAEPMIVVAHGLDGDPVALAPLFDTWAREGYVIVAPMFPTTVKDAGGNSVASETTLQAGDLHFVISRMLAGNRDPTSPWFRRIDPDHIGAAGMSLGGLAVYAITTESCCTDRRVDAAVLMASVYRDVPDSEQHPNRIPMMLLQGDVDPGYHNSQEAYSDLVAPKWFLTLHGSRHAPPFEAPRGPEAAVVDPATIGFWDGYLRHDPTGPVRIAAAVRANHGTTSLQVDLGRPSSGG